MLPRRLSQGLHRVPRVLNRGFMGPTDLAQSGIALLHEQSSLPWCASIAISTVFVRASLLPLVCAQMREVNKLQAAMAELNFLVHLLKTRLGGPKDKSKGKEINSTLTVFWKGVKACTAIYDVSPRRLIIPPLVNFAGFVTFVYSVRSMVINGNYEGLECGGLFWFTDLTSKDSTLILPLLAIGTSYASIDYAFASPPSAIVSKDAEGREKNMGGGALNILKDTLQLVLICSIPFIVQMPAGIFCYWIPSSTCGMMQTKALRNPRVKAMLGIDKSVKIVKPLSKSPSISKITT